ncbi:asparagine synthase (glutamine-hydrolysing) [Myxococcaceae bacterium]|jgi:asparagine synthase (glutamine-hydrolysing)|nr:asparagine synthase (glutamine-hydrolysing) [Myxococcaceae bacterium]
MCGIAGVFAYGAERFDLDEHTLGRMTDAMAHRGPDGRGLHFDPELQIGLGHRRLSIIDLSDLGHQPMSNDDGTVWIVFNGEIYNHAAIRRELEADGVRFRSRCDTEVILRLYERAGDSCAERLLGMFAFAIWDSRKSRLLVVRDRIGIKPLVYCDVGGHFFFASEVRALLEHPLVPRKMDGQSLWHNLTFLSTPAPGTMFERIRKLPAGHRLVVSPLGIRVERWWDALDAPGLSPSDWSDEQIVVGEIRSRLKTAIRDRMMSDVPFGVFLSGGIDSSTNVALMSQCTDRPVETFTVGFSGAGTEAHNELHHASRVAEMYGAKHHRVVVDQASVLDYMPQLIHQQDEPNLDPVCVPLYYVSKLAREHGIKVIQVGEGSDEMFLGYSLYLQQIAFAKRLAPLSRMPDSLRRSVHAVAGPLMRAVGHRVANWEEYVRRVAHGERIFWGGAILLGDREKAGLLRRIPPESSWSVLSAFYNEIESRWPTSDVAARMSYIELRQRLPELLLARVDKITMSVSLEGRVPFLDHRLVEYVLRLPMSLKLAGGKTKSLLKRAVGDLLPADLIERRKQGFPAPMATWMFEGEFGRDVREVLRTSELVRDGWLDGTAVAAHVDHLFQRRQMHLGGLLWTLYNMTLWYRRWILGN